MTTVRSDLILYASYKDSGVAWLGEIPGHWTVHAIGRVASVQLSSVDKLSDEEELPIHLCNYVDVYKNDFITKRLPFMAATASPTEMGRFALEVGDVLITKDSETWNDIAVPALVTEGLPGVLCGYHLAQIRPIANVLYGPYLFRSLQALPIAEQFHVLANGVTRFGLSKRAIKSGTIPVPPLEEQRAIARFLDQQDRRVNRFIRAKRRLIELLNEQKQATIHQAVTRGLDSDVPLKPSGVDWLGDTPAHWDIVPLKRLFREVDRRSISGTETLLSLRMHRGLVPHEEVSEIPISYAALVGYKHVSPGQLVMNRMRASIGLFGVATQPGLVSPDYAVFDCSEAADPDFFLHLFRTRAAGTVFRLESKGLGTGSSGFMRLYSDRFGAIRAPLPPIADQLEIVRGIEEMTREVDATIARVEREVELVREYRTRLIADVVTGKLDVREAAAMLLTMAENEFQTLLEDEESTRDLELEELEESALPEGVET